MKNKYKIKYARELENGKCKDGSSVNKCCREWGITRATFVEWTRKYPRFAHAAELAKLDRAIWWEELYQDIAAGKVKGNAGTAQFAMKNIDAINWTDKVEVDNKHDDEVKTINIVMIEPRHQQTKIIEQEKALLEDADTSRCSADAKSN